MEGLTGQNEAAIDTCELFSSVHARRLSLTSLITAAADRYWTTMLQGVCIGFFVPFLPFFFFRSQIFSRT